MSKSSFLPIDRTLSGATTPSQNGPGSDGNEGVLYIPQSSSITGASLSDHLMLYTQDTRWEDLIPWQRFSRVGCLYVVNNSSLVVISSNQASGCPRGVMVKAMDCGIVISEFVLQSHYYVHFQANTIGKGMNPLILPAMG